MADDNTRGFGSMDEEKQKEIARKGGQASQGGGQSSQMSSGMGQGGGKGWHGDSEGHSEARKKGEGEMGEEEMGMGG